MEVKTLLKGLRSASTLQSLLQETKRDWLWPVLIHHVATYQRITPELSREYVSFSPMGVSQVLQTKHSGWYMCEKPTACVHIGRHEREGGNHRVESKDCMQTLRPLVWASVNDDWVDLPNNTILTLHVTVRFQR